MKLNLPTEFLDRLKLELGKDFESYKSAMEQPAVRGIRVNTAKTGVSEFLQHFDCELKPLPFCDDGFILCSDKKLGNTIDHIAGLIYLQEPSSMISVCASNPSGSLKVLDLCASPGGKTGQIASRLSSDSVIISNEVVPSRASVLFSNVERLGLKNVIITNNSASDFKDFEEYFDYVFVDAPCSGEGMFRKNPDTISEWSLKIVDRCSQRQKQIISDIFSCVKPNGYLVYSTCTFSKEEDEQVVEFLLSLGFEICKVPDSIKSVTLPAKFDRSVAGGEEVRKFYPFFSDGEGQFVTVLKRCGVGSGSRNPRKNRAFLKLSKKENELLADFVGSTFISAPSGKFVRHGDMIYLVPESFDEDLFMRLGGLNTLSIGVKFGSIQNERFVPHHSIFMAYGELFKNKIELNDTEIVKYLHGEELSTDSSGQGYCVVANKGRYVGGVRAVNKKLKNILPKGLRL